MPFVVVLIIDAKELEQKQYFRLRHFTRTIVAPAFRHEVFFAVTTFVAWCNRNRSSIEWCRHIISVVGYTADVQAKQIAPSTLCNGGLCRADEKVENW